jgi:hypothetical protein
LPSQWHYTNGGTPLGPVSSERLRELAALGELTPADLVWKEGMTEWRRASSLQGLFPKPVVPPSTPPPLPLFERPLPPPVAGMATWLKAKAELCREEADGYLKASEARGGWVFALAKAVEPPYQVFQPWFGAGLWKQHLIRSYILMCPFAFLWTIRNPRSTWVLGKIRDIYGPPWTGDAKRLAVALVLIPVLFFGLWLFLLLAIFAVVGPPMCVLNIFVMGGLMAWNSVKYVHNLGARERDKW